ncbi:ribosome-binding protein 1 [Gastrophryne carolinensis]
MDLYDPQNIGAMVFGGFMVISAIGIFLVSTFSMKETSYEEALAKQRKDQEKGQSKGDKKKKDKVFEKKGKPKKNDKPNGKIPEHESASDNEPEPEIVAEVVKIQETPVAPAVVQTQEKAVPSPKDKKKKQDKKAQKEEPAQNPIVAATKPVAKPAPVVEALAKEVTAAPIKSNQPVSSKPPVKSQANLPVTSAKSAKTPANQPTTSAQNAKTQANPPVASTQNAKTQANQPASSTQNAKAQANQPASSTQSAKTQANQQATSSQNAKTQANQQAASTQNAKTQANQPASSTQSAKTQANQQAASTQNAKTQANQPASSTQSAKTQANQPASSTQSAKTQANPTVGSTQSSKTQSSPPVLSAKTQSNPPVAKNLSGPPAASTQSAKAQSNSSAAPPKKTEPIVNQEEQKSDAAPKKKNAAKKKADPVSSDLDGAIYLPYKTIVSTISSMVFSEGEAQKLIEILIEKNGVKQDAWHTATQKGDPVTALKKQLDEKEKLLSAEQEDSAAAKNKLREINKELATEKAKTSSIESKFKDQIRSRDQEMNALQARMQASYQDHVTEVQQLQGKIRSLQEELENGPKAQLARLQQENSILRDALNQATSQTESKQNAELAKLRQECTKLSKELTDKSEALLQEEQKRKSLDGKVSAYEKQVSQLQSLQQENESTLQKRLDEVSEELRKSQNSYQALLADTEKGKEEQKNLTDLQTKLMSSETDGKQKSEEVDRLNQKLKEVSGENTQLLERIKSIETLLEAGQSKDTNKDTQLLEAKEAEIAQINAKLQEKDAQVSLLEKQTAELKDTVEQHKNKNNELREKNWQAMDALGLAEKKCEEKVNAERKGKEELEQQLNSIQTRTKEALQALFPDVSVESHQLYSDWLQEFREKSSGVLKKLSQLSDQTDSSDLSVKLKEAEEAQATLQAECEQYRTILAETEGMLKDLQKSVEEEEQVWKAKLEASEEELRKSHIQMKTLEETVERLKLDVQSTDQLKECISLMEAQLETQMSNSSSECQTYSREVESLRQLLSESQEQLEATKTEARKQGKELSVLRQQLSEMQNHVHDSKDHQLKAPQSSLDEPSEHNISAQLEEKSMHSLQEELEKLKTSEEATTGGEEAQHLKERLDKEKKLSRDLGQAANKLLQLLKSTQEQLTKEKTQNKLLQTQLKMTEQDANANNGTSQRVSPNVLCACKGLQKRTDLPAKNAERCSGTFQIKEAAATLAAGNSIKVGPPGSTHLDPSVPRYLKATKKQKDLVSVEPSDSEDGQLSFSREESNSHSSSEHQSSMFKEHMDNLISSVLEVLGIPAPRASKRKKGDPYRSPTLSVHGSAFWLSLAPMVLTNITAYLDDLLIRAPSFLEA